MSYGMQTYSVAWKFVAATAASIAFILAILLSVELVIFLGAGQMNLLALTNFWDAFGAINSSKLVFGMALATLAITPFASKIFDLMNVQIKEEWHQDTLAYFVSYFTVIALSTASAFLAEFPNVPWTNIIACLMVTACCFAAAIVYGAVANLPLVRREPKS